MAYLNQTHLLGRLTTDPELRYIPGKDIPVCVFTLASNKPKSDNTLFIEIAVFGEYGKACHEHLKKGSLIIVSGELEYRKWDKGSEKHSKHTIKANDIQFIALGKPDEKDTDN
ncbi:single-stranded DNA-binding protein [Seleniivibrio woodruffii]|uniref:Single-stranded DNA-binding protein n=2 Tax=Seleniivibrio woodruffii TaxID=1078050 RepID=A0A4R1K5R6_9BACT|nr:single-stranded DNA-binding protein [Seleniivibrio woodruffii]TCK58389.1 single-strand DNA-binding protein [Seleniivibrio woodruffii]TVZ36762.1 single-strand DNA-binding protein [Seleniivibrio woodruffii]